MNNLAANFPQARQHAAGVEQPTGPSTMFRTDNHCFRLGVNTALPQAVIVKNWSLFVLDSGHFTWINVYHLK